MINLIMPLLTLFSMLLLTLTCMSITSSFINDKSNPFSLKKNKIVKNINVSTCNKHNSRVITNTC